MKLVIPNKKYKESFLSAIKGYKKLKNKSTQDKEYAEMFGMSDKEFDNYIQTIKDEANGINLKPGYSSSITYWLIDNEEYIGTIRLRPNITKKQAENFGHVGYDVRPNKRKMGYGTNMLELLFKKAEKLGLKQICISCYTDNIPSKKNNR
ncbi:MAG: GNAT family N-acetyltransferase [Alphaproteobacteria bacterium]|nr:GNAT family N-acetyltransferase [Alphaproteobacteria bacterium]MBN2675317.1 GNAT family N-acetyltransferase [Alphaproteobacteria bacterium]